MRARPASSSSRRTPSATTSRAPSSTRPSGTTARAAGRCDDEACKPFFEKCKELGIKNIHAHKGPTIWPLDKDAFDVKDVDVAATEQPRAQLHRRARGPAADRGLLLHGHAGAERLRGPRGRARRPDARPAPVLRQGDGRAAVLGRRGQDAVRQRLRDLGAEVADRGVPQLGLPRRRVLGLPPRDRRDAAEDPRA